MGVSPPTNRGWKVGRGGEAMVEGAGITEAYQRAEWKGMIRRRHRRGKSVSAVALASAAAVIVLLAPAASAGTAKTLIAPYTGYNESYEFSQSRFCGLGTKVLSYPNFNLTTGKTTEGANTTAKSCPGPRNVVADNAIFEESGLTANLTTGLHGLVHFVAHWVLSYSGHLHVHSGGPGQTAFGSVEIEVTAFLYNNSSEELDFSAFTKTYSLNSTTGHDLAISATKVAVSVFLNATLDASDLYAFYTNVQLTVTASVTMGGSSTADAQLSMYGHGGSATLSYFKF